MLPIPCLLLRVNPLALFLSFSTYLGKDFEKLSPAEIEQKYWEKVEGKLRRDSQRLPRRWITACFIMRTTTHPQVTNIWPCITALILTVRHTEGKSERRGPDGWL